MGLRCLLGHDFGEPELERDRKEDGDEVVITVREVKTCDRCGERQIVSENKEVTSIEQLADAADTAADAPADAAESGAGPADDAATAPADAEAAIAEAEEPVQPGEPGAEPSVGADPGAEAFDGEDDAVLIDDGTDEAAEATGTADGPAPDLGGIEDGASAEADAGSGAASDAEAGDSDAEDAEILDDGPSGAGHDPHLDAEPDADAEGEVGHGEWPDAGADSATEADPETDPETDDGVILEDEPEVDPDREYGEWPEPDEEPETADEPAPWPEHRTDDEGYDAEVGSGDEDDGGVTFGGGLTPEVDPDQIDHDEDAEDAEFIESTPAPTAADEPPEGGSEASARGDSGTDRATDSGPASSARDRDFAATEGAELTTTMNETDTEYYCPECEMSRGSDGNSMRAGDICPECKRGYVQERQL